MLKYGWHILTVTSRYRRKICGIVSGSAGWHKSFNTIEVQPLYISAIVSRNYGVPKKKSIEIRSTVDRLYTPWTVLLYRSLHSRIMKSPMFTSIVPSIRTALIHWQLLFSTYSKVSSVCLEASAPRTCRRVNGRTYLQATSHILAKKSEKLQISVAPNSNGAPHSLLFGCWGIIVENTPRRQGKFVLLS